MAGLNEGEGSTQYHEWRATVDEDGHYHLSVAL